MGNRTRISPELVADVVTMSRRRCCLCYALKNDDGEKRGQIAHLDRDSGNSAFDNLAFLCLEHHDLYDSSTSQSKGLTIEEVKRYRTELYAYVAQRLPPGDAEIIATLTAALDRPAFRTPFHNESSLPRFQSAIMETIETLNTGRTPQGIQLPSKAQIRDLALRSTVDKVVEALVGLRASFDDLLRRGAIRHCGCQNPDCPVYMLTDDAAHEMDTRRRKLLALAHSINPDLPRDFYELQ
jgi:hypothetical protein